MQSMDIAHPFDLVIHLFACAIVFLNDALKTTTVLYTIAEPTVWECEPTMGVHQIA